MQISKFVALQRATEKSKKFLKSNSDNGNMHPNQGGFSCEESNQMGSDSLKEADNSESMSKVKLTKKQSSDIKSMGRAAREYLDKIRSA